MGKRLLWAWLPVVMFVLASACAPRSDPDEAPLPDGAQYVLDFLRANPDKFSLSARRDDVAFADVRADRMMPLASTVKMILAIEYAYQAAAGVLSPYEQVALPDLERFYLPGSDGGAHSSWLSYEYARFGGAITSVPLEEVAKGMMWYSSNANSEYLMDRLGIDNVHRRLESLGVGSHGRICPFSSALFILRNTESLPESEFLATLRAMSQEEWESRAQVFHDQLANDNGALRDSFLIYELNLDRQGIWSDRLPASTTREYVEIARKMQSRTYFSPGVQRHIDVLLEEWLMQNPGNVARFEHAGLKGGGTAFVLTEAAYWHERGGARTEYAIFFNELAYDERLNLSANLNGFRLAILQDSGAYRAELGRLP